MARRETAHRSDAAVENLKRTTAPLVFRGRARRITFGPGGISNKSKNFQLYAECGMHVFPRRSDSITGRVRPLFNKIYPSVRHRENNMGEFLGRVGEKRGGGRLLHRGRTGG